MYALRACRTTFFGATAAETCLWYVLRNSLGTWNMPNFSWRAKTLWSCERSETHEPTFGDVLRFRYGGRWTNV